MICFREMWLELARRGSFGGSDALIGSRVKGGREEEVTHRDPLDFLPDTSSLISQFGALIEAGIRIMDHL